MPAAVRSLRWILVAEADEALNLLHRAIKDAGFDAPTPGSRQNPPGLNQAHPRLAPSEKPPRESGATQAWGFLAAPQMGECRDAETTI